MTSEQEKNIATFWAARLILDYDGTRNNPRFRELDELTQCQAISIFHDQTMIQCGVTN